MGFLALGAAPSAPAPARGFLLQNLFCARTSAPRGVITGETAAVSEQHFQYPPRWRCPYCLQDISIGKAPTVSSNLPGEGLLFSALIWLMGLCGSSSSDVCLITAPCETVLDFHFFGGGVRFLYELKFGANCCIKKVASASALCQSTWILDLPSSGISVLIQISLILDYLLKDS